VPSTPFVTVALLSPLPGPAALQLGFLDDGAKVAHGLDCCPVFWLGPDHRFFGLRPPGPPCTSPPLEGRVSGRFPLLRAPA
jgi:hypothetical protein